MRSLFGLVAVLLLSPLASAQTDETPLEPGARALLFQIGPNFDLQSFSGGTVSLKWHRTEASARRLGVTVGVGANASDVDADNGGGLDQSQVRNSQSGRVGASLLFLTYQRARTPVYLYYGIGPSGGVSFNRAEEDTEVPGDGPSPGSIQSSVSASLGVAGALGVEWVVAPAISLTGEYSTSLLGTYSRTTTSNRTSDAGLTADVIGLDLLPGGARLGVSVYF